MTQNAGGFSQEQLGRQQSDEYDPSRYSGGGYIN